MPKLRLELYGYDFCINCSTVKPKVGRTLTLGTGDDTWNDLEILDQDVAKKVIELESTFKTSKKVSDEDLLDFNQEESYEESLSTTKTKVKEVLTSYDPDKPMFEEEEEEDLEDEDLVDEDDILEEDE
jgi:hypothetical protein